MIKNISLAILFIMGHFLVSAQKVYQLDLKKSTLYWKTGNTMGKHLGDIKFNSGSLIYNAQQKPINGMFIINMLSLRSYDNKDLNEDKKINQQLHSVPFFNIPKYPTAKMEVSKVIETGRPTQYQVTGNLTIKGITKTIVFLANITKIGTGIRITSNLKIDRIKWNINHQPNVKPFQIVDIVKDMAMADELPITLDLYLN